MVVSQLLLQVVIVVAFGALCFGCGYLTAFIVTRNQWRDEMIKRGVARYNWQTGKWEWGNRQVGPTRSPCRAEAPRITEYREATGFVRSKIKYATACA